MTVKQLHEIKDYAGLFTDERFRRSVEWLRANFFNAKSATGDEWRGYYGALEALERLAMLPAIPDTITPSAPYTKPSRTQQPQPESK